jgi:hypothetical protein
MAERSDREPELLSVRFFQSFRDRPSKRIEKMDDVLDRSANWAAYDWALLSGAEEAFA